MADPVTPGEKDKSPEEIEREMAETRASLTEKVSALENQVAGTVKNAAETLNNTVSTVRSLVSQAPEAVGGAVKQAAAAVGEAMKGTLDITGHVRRHPWPAVGASALLGCVVGWLLSRGSGSAPAGVIPQAAAAEAARGAAMWDERAAEKPGIVDEMFSMIGDKAKELARTALESVSTAVKDAVQTNVPNLVNEAAAAVTDHLKPEPEPFSSRLDAPRFSA